MSYIPQTKEDLREMLNTIGVSDVNELFKDIPKLLTKRLNIPEGISEAELLNRLKKISTENASTDGYNYFIGGGAYYHFIPAIVDDIISRSEFYTAYTPYQPEISQGTLQAIFEFQTYMSMITGMDVSNASMYDGASSTAEAILMSFRLKKKSKVIVAETINPDYMAVIKTYLSGRGEDIKVLPYNRETGRINIEELKNLIDQETASVVIQSPNFFGIIEDLDEIEKIVHAAGALMIVNFTEIFAYGLLKPPGYFNADIVAGEGQSFGMPISYGGPYLGILATKRNFVRTMPGRLVGETTDRNGKRAYVLTLSAREQHIRREKATSNICSNEGLCALAATVYLSALGKSGLYEIAKLNHLKAEMLKNKLSSLKNVKIRFPSPTFNEFVVEIGKDVKPLMKYLYDKGFIAGLDLSDYYPEMKGCLLLTTTEMNGISDIESLVNHIKNYMS